ncbi:hypothetical protein HG530_013815 [Fusarium avenaceum]|nr:hypothetical protein HG530_013815 [Fusarium avenaceum]
MVTRLGKDKGKGWEQRSAAVGLSKVGNRVALRNDLLAIASLDRGGVCHTVTSRLEGIVCQALERVADVEDDVCGCGGLDVVEVAQVLLVFDLQTADRVLEEHGDGAKVGVFGDTCGGTVGEFRSWNGGVVEDAELVLSASLKKQQLSLESLLIESLHELAEARQLLLRNPEVINKFIIGRAKVDCLLDIPGLEGPEALLVAADVGDVLLADEGVAAVGVGLGRVLGDHLCLEGEVEEALRLGEELVDIL